MSDKLIRLNPRNSPGCENGFGRSTLCCVGLFFITGKEVQSMERIAADQQQDEIEVFENDIQLYLKMFCEEQKIKDIKRESQAVWNSALRYIYRHIFKNTDRLKSHTNISVNNNTIPSTFNAYDYKKVLDVLDIYIFDMCMRYDKEVSIIGFSTLTGIDQSVIYDWGNNSSKLSETSSEIYKKLNQFREESLSDKLATGNKNPVGILAILNRHYQWNLPGVSKEQSSRQALTADKLPDLRQQIEAKD